ncbi:hypothetical protein, partial [uncultured Tateyamaria sp.]|uniref:hypothetical protein n=1 Tax=uncultured Tateyamaria sp. TaxID=455651 RepID=UPI002605C5C6
PPVHPHRAGVGRLTQRTVISDVSEITPKTLIENAPRVRSAAGYFRFKTFGNIQRTLRDATNV